MLADGVLCKLCDAEDFFSPPFLPYVAAIGETPTVQRKQWEYAMIVRGMEESGALHERADVLGLACEREPIIYYAANRARSVLATDLYAGSHNPGWAAGHTREEDVYEGAPFQYPRDRLRVRTMDMRRIDAPDESLDLVWSACALEHVDTMRELATVLREVGRVLRPGGIHVFTTEWKLSGGYSYFPNSFIFDRPLLERTLREMPLEPLGPIDLRFSQHALNTPVWRGLRPVFDRLSHIVLYSRGVLHTSLVLVFRKSQHAGHKLDFINEDPAVCEWIAERYRAMLRAIASPLNRARLLVDGTLGAWLAEAQTSRNERCGR
jgi:SAM-dependent methyltransferase